MRSAGCGLDRCEQSGVNAQRNLKLITGIFALATQVSEVVNRSGAGSWYVAGGLSCVWSMNRSQVPLRDCIRLLGLSCELLCHRQWPEQRYVHFLERLFVACRGCVSCARFPWHQVGAR
jgi:hypothetical protein